MEDQREFARLVRSPDLSSEELYGALDAWARADGGRVVRAVVYLLQASKLAQTWPDFGEHLSIQLYNDPADSDPETRSYPVARVLDWNSLHNAIPGDIGKRALSLFVYARCLGDRGFVVCLSDLLGGMEPATQLVVHEANAIRFGSAAKVRQRD